MSDTASLADSRLSLGMLRWFAILGTLGLPFTYSHGPIELRHILSAWALGTVITVTQLMRCRTRRDLWGLAGFAAIMFGGRALGPDAKSPTAIIFQWGCLLVIFAGAPLLLFKKQLLRFARLDKENSQTTQDQPNE